MSYKLNTVCIHGKGLRKEVDKTGSVVFPLYQTAAFVHPDIVAGETHQGYNYSRFQNPTREELERVVNDLEGGYGAIAFSSGMATIDGLMRLFRPGDHVILGNDLYGGTERHFEGFEHDLSNIDFTFVDTSDLGKVEKAFKPNTKAIYVETPTNPMMHVTDIAAIAKLAHAHKAILIVDNTFMTPYFQNPIPLGADVVVHSATKYLGGHNDTMGGILVVNSKDLYVALREIVLAVGSNLAPFDSWLILRGIKTLGVRMERHQANALAIVRFLKTEKRVKKIYFVGLADSQGFAITKRQCRGFSGMITFRVDSPSTAKYILDHVRLIEFAESLGGTETLLTYPLTQTHFDVPEKVRKQLGIDDCLLCLSVGLEDSADLIADLKQAIEGAPADDSYAVDANVTSKDLELK